MTESAEWSTIADAAVRRGCATRTVQNWALGGWVKSCVRPGRTRQRLVWWPDVEGMRLGSKVNTHGHYAGGEWSGPPSAVSVKRLDAALVKFLAGWITPSVQSHWKLAAVIWKAYRHLGAPVKSISAYKSLGVWREKRADLHVTRITPSTTRGGGDARAPRSAGSPDLGRPRP